VGVSPRVTPLAWNELPPAALIERSDLLRKCER
jgi:hypothetical protein